MTNAIDGILTENYSVTSAGVQNSVVINTVNLISLTYIINFNVSAGSATGVTYVVQVQNGDSAWVNTSSPTSVSVNGNVLVTAGLPMYQNVRIQIAVSGGTLAVQLDSCGIFVLSTK